MTVTTRAEAVHGATYKVQADGCQHEGPDHPAGELEAGVPLIHPGLEPRLFSFSVNERTPEKEHKEFLSLLTSPHP